MQSQINAKNKRSSSLLSSSINNNSLDLEEKSKDNLIGYINDKQFSESDIFNSSISKEVLSFSLDINKNISNKENTQEKTQLNKNLIKDNINLNSQKESNCSSASSSYSNNNTIIMEKSSSTIKINDENRKKYKISQKSINNSDDNFINKESRLSYYSNNESSINKSPALKEFSKDINDLSNNSINSDVSLNNQSKVRLSKQGSTTTISSNVPNILTNNEDTLLELSVNSLELLGSYLKNSSNESLVQGLQNSSLYEENLYVSKKNSENSIEYYNKKASSIILPYLKLNEFIEDQEISETIASISKGWPVEKSGFVLRKMIYSNGVYKNMTNNQDKKGKNEISVVTNDKESKNSNQSKRKGKHKKSQSHDSNRHSNDFLYSSTNSNSSSSELKDSKDWDWILYYVELRGQYLFFYRLYNNDPYWKKDSHNKYKSKPGTLENIRNVFVERIISFGRNKKNSNHTHSSSNNNNSNRNNNVTNNNIKNNINDNNVLNNTKIQENLQLSDIYDQQNQKMLDKITSEQKNNINSTQKQKLRSIQDISQGKPTLQQQLLASQNIHPRDHNNKNSSSSVSRSFTFANISTANYKQYSGKSSMDSNTSLNSNTDINSNSPDIQSGLPPHPIYSTSFSNRQCINNNSTLGSPGLSSPGFSSPYPSPINTNFSALKNSSSSQLTPNSLNSSNDIDYAPIIVPTVLTNGNSKSNSYPQMNMKGHSEASPYISTMKNTYTESETEMIRDGLSEMDTILPPQMIVEDGVSSSVISSSGATQINSPKEMNDVENSLINATSETIETRIITTNVTSQIVNDYINIKKPLEDVKTLNTEISKNSTLQTMMSTTVTTATKTTSTLSTSTTSNLSVIGENSEQKIMLSPNRVDSLSNLITEQKIMSSPNRVDSLSNLSTSNKFNNKSTSSISPSLSMNSHQTSIDSSNGYKMKRKSKIHELHTSSAIDNVNDYSRNKTSYLQSDTENSVSNEISLNNGQKRNLQENTKLKKINELSAPARRLSNSNYIPSTNSPHLRDSVNNKYKNNVSSPQLYNINENNSLASLPPTTPINGSSYSYGGKNHNNHINHSRHSSIQKQKYNGKILGKPIMTLDDVNGPLDVLRAQHVLVHYIPLNYSVVEQLTYNERSNGVNGIISNEIPLLLLTYVNQDKDFSSACQVLLQMTNIGLGIMNTPTMASSVPKIVSSSLRTPKQESVNSDIYYISSPLIRQRQSQSQGSPVLTSSQIPSNFSLFPSNNGNKTPVLSESFERESHLIENEINDWSRHIQQSSSVLENPSINYSSLGYGRFSHEDVSPQILWNEERQNINYNNYIPKSVSYGGTSNSSINIKNVDAMNSTILPSSVHSIPSITSINTHQNLSANIKQEINSATSNRSFFSDIAPTFYEGNSTSFALESFTENNQIPIINSTVSLNETTTNKEESGIEINRMSKHNEFNQSFISHSLPYNYKTLEITRTSPFISSPSTRSLDDDRIGLPIEEGMSGTEKSSSPYPLVTDISEIKPSDGLKVPFHNDLSSSSSLTTLISQDSVKSKQSKLNAISEESFGKEPLGNDRELCSFEVVKSKDKELEEGSTSIILPNTPSLICEEASSEIINNNVNSPNSNSSSTKMINFEGNKSKSINSLTNDTIKNNSSVYKDLTTQNSNSNNAIIPPQKPQKSIKRIQENNELKASQNNSKSDNLYVDVNNLIQSRKTGLGNTFIKNKRNQLKLKMNIENTGSPLRTYENIPSPVQSISSLKSNSNEDCSSNSNSNLTVSTPIQKQPLFMPKAKQGKEHIKYPRRESLKQHLIVMTLDKGQSKSSINQGPLSAPPYMDIYNNELKEDYKMQSVVKENNMKKSSLSKIKEKIHEKPTKPNKENVFENKPFPRRASLKDNIIFDGGKYRKEKEVNELNKKLSKEMEKKQLKEKEALKKKSKKEAKREKKEKKNEEKLEKQEKKHQEKLEKLNINKLKISSPQPLTDDEVNLLNSPKSTTKKEKSKKGWYQIALSKLPTKSLNSQNKKNNLFSDFKKGDTSTEILIKRTPTCSSHTSVRRRVVSSNRASICTNGTNNTVSSQASIPYASPIDSLPEVPTILMKCVKLIEECGLETEGLYRISGNSSNVQNLLKLFNHEPDKIQLLPPGSEPQKSSSRKTFKSSSNIPPPSSNLYKDSKYLYDNDIHVVTGCIKSWLRNGIPPKNEPLWPYNMYDDLIKASQIKDYTTRMISFQDLVHALPPMNFTALNFLFEHLFKVSTFSEQNKMTISNLAIIFGPTLLKSPPNSKENEIMIITRMPFQCKAVEILIEQYEWLFGPIEYEEESIDEEELGKELINSSFHEIQNHLQDEIKDNEVVILKNNSDKNDIDVMVSTTDKMGFPILNNLEINKNDLIDISTTTNKDKENKNELDQSSNKPLNIDFKTTEDNIDGYEEPNEETECNNSISRNEKNYFKFEKDDYEYNKSEDSHEERYKNLSRSDSSNRSNFDLSLNEKELNEKKNLELNKISEGKESEYLKSMNIESIQKMKKASEDFYELIKDDDESDRSSKENKKKDNKDKSKIKIKNSSSSNRLKQLLSRPNKSKKIDDLNLSHSDIKSLISSPITVQHNTLSIPKENNKLILNNINKNQDSLNYNNEKNINIMTSTHENLGYEINLNIPSNDIYEKLSENKIDQIYIEPSGTDNDISEKTLANQNSNSESNHSKKKGKGLSQKVSNSSMRIFQEQFLMDGFENDIESSLNDYLSNKFEMDDENSSLGDDKDNNIIKKKSIIRLSTQMTAKLNLELEKHLEQIYKDKKRSKLIINNEHEDIDERINNRPQKSVSKSKN